MTLRIVIITSAVILGLATAAAADECSYRDQKFSEGASVCQSGTQFRCDDGEWKSLGLPCAGGPHGQAGDAPMVAPAGKRSCALGDSTVSSASTVCRSGITFLCNDGEWQNLGRPCQ